MSDTLRWHKCLPPERAVAALNRDSGLKADMMNRLFMNSCGKGKTMKSKMKYWRVKMRNWLGRTAWVQVTAATVNEVHRYIHNAFGMSTEVLDVELIC